MVAPIDWLLLMPGVILASRPGLAVKADPISSEQVDATSCRYESFFRLENVTPCVDMSLPRYTKRIVKQQCLERSSLLIPCT